MAIEHPSSNDRVTDKQLDWMIEMETQRSTYNALCELRERRTEFEPLSVPAQHREGSEPLSRLIGDLDYCIARIDPVSSVGMALVRIGVGLRNLNKRTAQPPSDVRGPYCPDTLSACVNMCQQTCYRRVTSTKFSGRTND